ncbi:hypothetical protein AMJ52_08585 [candidate division TA06 bacterium DG_78]|uniref:Uncharacterized protein n=1 Tax=candidate division TA06 bacterium DG_78 TaxID=1703772 RepID=A0A0S7Y9E8_UNCT6|nr:MAG: hypothetical protein AMJ52_08585 [candidate division TA06 bacterium DG_78]
MDKKILKEYEDKGLSCPFSILRSGETFITKQGESQKNELSQMGMVIFETISTIGNIKIDAVEILGDKKGVVVDVAGDRLVGSLFNRTPAFDLQATWALISELKGHPSPVAAVVPKEKVRTKLEVGILDEIKATVKDYLGDFSERIYQNQLKKQRINVDELYDDDARRFIFALGKAAGMIIGPSKGTQLTNKLLKLLK